MPAKKQKKRKKDTSKNDHSTVFFLKKNIQKLKQRQLAQMLVLLLAIFFIGASVASSKIKTLRSVKKGSITHSYIGRGSVDSINIKDKSIKTVDLSDSSITSVKIRDGNINTDNLADNSVTSGKIADGEIIADDIRDGTITAAKMAAGVLTSDGSGSSAWGSITGTLSDQTDLQNALDDKADKQEITVGDEGYGSTFAEAITAIASTQATLIVPSGTHEGGGVTVPANVTLKVLRGALIHAADGTTLTLNGDLEAGLYQVFSWSGSGSMNGNPQIEYWYAEWFGAVGDDSTDDYAEIQKTITVAQASGRPYVQLLGKTYFCSDTLEIPNSGVNHHSKFVLHGIRSATTDTTNSPEGTVIRVPESKDGLRLPIVPDDGTQVENFASWAKSVEISDLYVKGPMMVSSAFSDTKGFRLGGAAFFQGHNLHAEGFGFGFYLANGVDYHFTGMTWAQNNYYGLYAARTHINNDMLAYFDYLMTVHNYIGVWFQNPRVIWINGGENITYGKAEQGILSSDRDPEEPRIKITGCDKSAEIHISNYSIESDEYENTSLIDVDSSGLSVLTLDKCNFENTHNRVISIDGLFHQISITNSKLEYSYLFNQVWDHTAGHVSYPVVELNYSGTMDPGYYEMENQVKLEGNSPAWADAAVKNSMVGHSPYGDYVPAYFQQINGRREMDEAGDNRLTALGTPSFTNSNVLAGKARAYFATSDIHDGVDNNGFEIKTPRPLKGAKIIYVTAIVDDNGGDSPPYFSLDGAFTGGVDYNIPFEIPLETYLVGSRIFTKWLACIMVWNETKLNSPGINGIKIQNIYYNSSGDHSASGIEMANVYVDTRQVGYVEPVPEKQAAVPSSAEEGWHAVGDIIYNTSPSAGGAWAWVCTAAGNPGTWKAINLEPDP